MERDRLGIFCFLLCLIFAITAAEDTNKPRPTFSPIDYKLMIFTREEHFKNATKPLTFEGKVEITFNMTRPKDFNEDFQIVLDTNPKMNKKTLKLEGFLQSNSTALKVTDSLKDGKLIVSCTKDQLKYSKFMLTVEYNNPFADDMTGFYRSSYKGSKGDTRWLLTTQFEPISARKAFPCFDQPNLKANFEIQITIPKSLSGYHALCNTVAKREAMGDTVKFNCQKTVTPMSTYLVAFTISDFIATSPRNFTSDYNSKVYGVQRQIKTYGQEKIIKKGDADLAQIAALGAITELTKYLGLGYAYEKVDQVGIPDFSAGAMENWGLITFREKSLFYNPKTVSTSTKQYNVLTITHELVHQWFGNLVTLESWNYIWLNEAFATYLGYVLSHKISALGANEWKYLEHFLVSETHLRAFETDATLTAKPMTQDIRDENLIFSAFNDIPYSKGGSVLRMWHHENQTGFEQSMREYLKKRQASFANPGHLYESLKAGMNMSKEAFQGWTQNPGYPVMQLEEVEPNHWVLKQLGRFLWEPQTSSTADQKWVVPITYTTSKSKKFQITPPKIMLKDDPFSIKDPNIEWIIVNVQQTGYFRVNYEKKNWEALSRALKQNHSEIHELNRAQIINDIFSLARSLQRDYVGYSTALELSKYLSQEDSLIVWKTALNIFEFLRGKLYRDKAYEKFKEHVLLLVKPHFHSVNCSGQSHVNKLKTVELSRMACSLDFKPCVEDANRFYASGQLEPDNQETILCTVIRNKKDIWDDVYKKYEKEEDSSAKVMYLNALGCTNDEKQAEAFLKKTLEPASTIRKQDKIFVPSSVYNGNLKHVGVCFKFVLDNYKYIATEYGGINPLGRAILGLARKLESKEDLEKLKNLKELIKKTPEAKPATESVEAAIGMVQSNMNWASKRKDQLITYLNSGSLASLSIGILSLCLTFVFNFQ